MHAISLRTLSRQKNAATLIDVLAYAQRWTAAVPRAAVGLFELIDSRANHAETLVHSLRRPGSGPRATVCRANTIFFAYR